MAYILSTRFHEEDAFQARCGVILGSTLRHRVIAQDRNGNNTVVREHNLRPHFQHDVWHPLPLSFTDLEESLLQHLTAVVECSDLRQRIVDSILSEARYIVEPRTDFIMRAFRAFVDVDLYIQEEVEPGSFDSVEDTEACGICLEVMWRGGNELFTTPCHHVFHISCIARWLDKSLTCPFCRNHSNFSKSIGSILSADVASD